jgi:hypothetical protein
MSFAATANAEDNPSRSNAMNRPNQEGLCDAMRQEHDTLTIQKDEWEIETRAPWLNVPRSTWAFQV